MLVLALIVGTLAVARITRLLVEDRLTIRWRRWVVDKTGADSMPAYLAHCSWCMSLWVSVPIMLLAALLPYTWLIAIFAVPAASYVTGMLADRKE
jgi:hypothetical protein